MWTNNCHKSDRPNSIGCRIPWRHCRTSSEPNCRAVFVKNRVLSAGARTSPTVLSRPLLPFVQSDRCLLSLGCTFSNATKRCTPFDTSNSRGKRLNSGAIMEKAWAERGKKKGKAIQEKRQLAILHKNTDKARILDAIAISQLRCHYTTIIHCLWGTETYHAGDKHRDAYFPESFTTPAARQISRYANRTVASNATTKQLKQRTWHAKIFL